MANSKKPPVAMSTKPVPVTSAPVSPVPAKPVVVAAPVAPPVETKPASVASPVAAAKVEAPKVEAVKAEAPKLEAAKAEAPKVEAAKAEAPKVEAAKPATAKAEPVKAEPAKAEAPKPVAPVVAKAVAPVAAKPVAPVQKPVEAVKPVVAGKPAVVSKPSVVASKPLAAPKIVETAPKQAAKAAAKVTHGFPVVDVLKPVAALQENVRANTEKALTEIRGRYAEVKDIAETATTRLEDSMKAAQSGSREISVALFEIVKAQAHANLDHAKTLAGARTFPDLVKAQQEFVLSQFQSAQMRTMDVAELAGKVANNVASPLRASFELMLRR